MSENADPRGRDLKLADLLRLRKNGLIGPVCFGQATFAIRENTLRPQTFRMFIPLLGAGYLVAAIAFLFPIEWQSLSQWQILVQLTIGLALLLTTAFCVGLETVTGQVALIFATMVTGASLYFLDRYYGISPTGFGLLAVWPVTVLPWLVFSRSQAHWLIWTFIVLGLSGASISMYLVPAGWLPAPLGPFLLAAISALALFSAEIFHDRGIKWLAARWPRHVLLSVFLTILYAALFAHLFPDIPGFEAYASGPISAAVCLTAIASSIWYYRFRAPDRCGFTIAVTFAGLVICAAVSRLIMDRFGQNPLDPSGLIGWLILFVAISAILGITAALLNVQYGYYERGEEDAG